MSKSIYAYKNVTSTSTDGTLMSGRGVLHSIVVNAPPAADRTVTVYDNTAATGTTIATLTIDSTSVQHPHTGLYDVAFKTGLHVVVSGDCNITVCYSGA